MIVSLSGTSGGDHQQCFRIAPAHGHGSDLYNQPDNAAGQAQRAPQKGLARCNNNRVKCKLKIS
eukprot:scaffold114596_cov17-Prasinocladus_malaysianus.AAC.2